MAPLLARFWDAADAPLLLLLFARIAPSWLLLSLLARGLVPWAVSLALAVALTLGLAPQEAGVGAAAQGSGLLWVAVLRELCVGGVFALLSALPLLLVWGSAQPLTWALVGGPEAALFARLYVLMAAVLVLTLGGHRAWLRALARSLRDLPLGQAVWAQRPWFEEVRTIVEGGLQAALALGLPFWLSAWLLDLTLAVVFRGHEALQHGGLVPLRRALALLLGALFLAPLASHAPELLRAALSQLPAVLRRLSP